MEIIVAVRKTFDFEYNLSSKMSCLQIPHKPANVSRLGSVTKGFDKKCLLRLFLLNLSQRSLTIFGSNVRNLKPAWQEV